MWVLNDKKQKIGMLTEFRERKITTILDSGDKELSFEYPVNGKSVELLKEENYIRTKTDEFVLKSVENGQYFNKYIAVLNVEELEGQQFPYGFESQTQTIKACLEFAFKGTNWIVRTCMITKKRTIDEDTSVSAWDILQKCLTTYRCECVIDSLNKTIDIYEQIGTDKGCYFVEGLNLRKLTLKSDTYDFYTRIYPIGKDGITPEVAIGKTYIDNFQYSSKVKAFVWKDERYSIIANLVEDATAKLEEMSRPYKAFTAEIVDLAKISEKYRDILSYGIGDTVTLVSKKTKMREKQRIVKITEYPESPEKNTVEISNVRKTFAQIQKEVTETAKEEAISIANQTTKKTLENYSTTEEIETKIVASKEEVELGVMHTLESYYDKTETDALIQISKGEIELSVSEIYQTKSDMGNYSTTVEMKAFIDIVSDEIEMEVSRATKAEVELSSKLNITAEQITSEVTRAKSAESSLSSRIIQTADQLTAEVKRASSAENNLSSRIDVTATQISSKVSKGDVCSEINQSAEQIALRGNRLVVESTNFQLDANGNAIFSGTVDGAIVVAKEKLQLCDQLHQENKTALAANDDALYIGIGFPDGVHVTGNLGVGGQITCKGIDAKNSTIEANIMRTNYLFCNAMNSDSHSHNYRTSDIYWEDNGNSNACFAGTSLRGASTTWVLANFERASCDERMKEDIANLDKKVISAYMDFLPVQYRYKEKTNYNKKLNFGVTAQNIMKTFEEHGLDWNLYDLIEQKSIYDKDLCGNIEEYTDGKDYYVVNDKNLHALHIFMLQEHQKKIELLEKDIKKIKQLAS